jgi:hypothetical protein
MLLSIHIAKTAGNSFREALLDAYGHDRVLRDYGDWSGFDEPFANRRRAGRVAAMRARRDELLAKYDVIHGHFVADKYLGLFPSADFLSFFREPAQQTLSHWRWQSALTDRRSDVNPEEHMEVRYWRELRPSVEEHLEWVFYRDHQSQFLGSLPIDALAFVGIYEEYEKSLELFKAVFGRDLGPARRSNVTLRIGDSSEVTPEVRRLVNKYRAADVELYERAKEIFRRQCRKYGVAIAA